jgi:hypothetical protein
MKKISAGVIFLIGVLGILLIWCLKEKAVQKTDCLLVDTFVSYDGYGYSISCNKEVLVYQPFIPAVEGNNPFKYKKDALRAGNLVMYRLRNGKLPTLKLDDLEELGIEF